MRWMTQRGKQSGNTYSHIGNDVLSPKVFTMTTAQITPTENTVALRRGDFQSLAEALDYAATGVTGMNFYSGKGELVASLPYAVLRAAARSLALKLLGLGLPRGARMALVADTDADFVRFFFACQYAGLVPVPLPAAVHLGGAAGHH